MSLLKLKKKKKTHLASGYCTETVLLGVTNDLLMAADKGVYSILVAQDLSICHSGSQTDEVGGAHLTLFLVNTVWCPDRHL